MNNNYELVTNINIFTKSTSPEAQTIWNRIAELNTLALEELNKMTEEQKLSLQYTVEDITNPFCGIL